VVKTWGKEMAVIIKNKTLVRNVHNLVYGDIIFIQKEYKTSKNRQYPPPPEILG
jgi:hypothetical protein